MKDFVASVDRSAVDIDLTSVLIATDFSPASDKALHQALAIAHHYGAKLYVVHVVPSLGYLMAGPESLAVAAEQAEDDLLRLKRELVRNDSLKGLNHEFIVCQGDVPAQLHSIITEKGIDLVVLGTHARRGIEKVVLGSVAEELFRHSGCHVLTVGPNSYQEDRVNVDSVPRSFLFATDFGEASVQAAPYAASLAHRLKARLIVMHVIPTNLTPQAFGRHSDGDVRQMREQSRMAILRRLEQLFPPEGDAEAPLEVEYIAQFGVPSEKVLQVALNRQADLIIIGLHHSRLVGTASHILGTTSYEVMCGAGCPVLTIRH